MNVQKIKREFLLGFLALRLDFISSEFLIESVSKWRSASSDQSIESVLYADFTAEQQATLRSLASALSDDDQEKLNALWTALLPDESIQALLIESLDAEISAEFKLLLNHTNSVETSDRYAQTEIRSTPASSAAIPTQAEPVSNSTAAKSSASIGAGKSAAAGRYEVLRAHAEGGLGRVHVALDNELNREVAFKDIKPQFADQHDARTRFLVEAEVTGGLEHPGIVPVYGLGHFSDGRPFYAMRFIRGQSFHRAISAFHSQRRPERRINEPAKADAKGSFDSGNQDSSRSGGEVPDDFVSDELANGPNDTFSLDRAIDSTVIQPGRKSQEDSAKLSKSTRQSGLDVSLHASGQGWERNLEFRGLINRMIDVCNAMQYAHARGIIHRDLKPDNVMLGDFGETLVVDWGLAKSLAENVDQQHASPTDQSSQPPLIPSSAHNHSATMTGSIIGTPAFMSPEQAAGKVDELGPSSDIYSLGAMLYSILTGKPPIHQSLNEPRFDLPELLRRVETGRFSTPRTVESSVPAALNAVCLKALNLKPRDRYVSAKSLADDLDAWLADEPVQAYQEPLRVRVRRWVRRHPALVSSTVATVFVAIISLTALSLVVTGKNQLLADSNFQLDNSNRQLNDSNQLLNTANGDLKKSNARVTTARNLAEANAQSAREQSQLALSTLQSVLFDVQESVQSLPGGRNVQRALLATVLSRLEKVSTEFVAKSSVDQSTFSAIVSMANVIQRIGPTAVEDDELDFGKNPKNKPESPDALSAAETLLNRALTIAEALVADQPNDPARQHSLTIALDGLGKVYLHKGDLVEAERLYRRALEIRTETSQEHPGFEFTRGLSLSNENLGKIAEAKGRTADAETMYLKALEISQQLHAEEPDDLDRRDDLDTSHNRLADFYVVTNRMADAFAQYKKALDVCQHLANKQPESLRAQMSLATVLDKLGYTALRVGEGPKAVQFLKQSLQIYEKFAALDPDDLKLQYRLSVSLHRVGDISLRAREVANALRFHTRAIEIRQMLAEQSPNDLIAQRSLSISQNKLGDIYFLTRRAEKAEEYYAKSLAIRQKLVDVDSANSEAQRDLSVSFDMMGDVNLTLGTHDAAGDYFRKSFQIQKELAEKDPGNRDAQRGLTVSLMKLGDLELSTQRLSESAAYLKQAQVIAESLIKANPEDRQGQRDLAIVLSKMGTVEMNRGYFKEGLECHQTTHRIMSELAKVNPGRGQAQSDAYEAASTLARAQLTAYEFEASEKSLLVCIALLDDRIRQKQGVASANSQKERMAKLLEYARHGKLGGTIKWESLLKKPDEEIIELVFFRCAVMGTRDQIDDAVQAAEKLEQLASTATNKKEAYFEAACCYGICLKLASGWHGVGVIPSKEERREFTEPQKIARKKHSDAATRMLSAAIAAGYSTKKLNKEFDFAGLLEFEDFRKLLPSP
jgi:eukaryotic-like serine/threonine-protein kinase